MKKATIKTMIAGVSALSVACSQPNSLTNGVSTSLTMTGSSSASTVAQYKIKHPWMSLFMPSAVALTPPAMTDSTGLNVSLNKAWIVVKEIELKADEVAGASEVEGKSNEIEFKGPFFVDLLSAQPASFGVTDIPAGTYRRIKMKLEKDATLPAGAPAGLQGNSIYFEATVAGNQITYSAADGSEFKISGAGGVNIVDSSNLLISLRIADLFKMLNLSGVNSNIAISTTNRVAGSNLCPLIDSSAGDLYTCIRKGLEKAGKLAKDDDGDHEIEIGEDDLEDSNHGESH